MTIIKPLRDSDGKNIEGAERIIVEFINKLSVDIFKENKAKGFWEDRTNLNPLERAGLVMLMVTELAEAVEADRKDLNDDKLPNRKGFEVELADALIRILDAAGGLNLELGEAVIEKLRYNRDRAYKHGKIF